MIEKSELSEVKKSIETCIGQRVQLKSNKGRRNTFVKEGILESTYPNIFVVKLDNANEISRRVTYSYTDILKVRSKAILAI
jgi:uncharacterized protein Veg